MKILVLNGPNINILGIREPEIYGRQSYKDLLKLISEHAEEKGVTVEFYQSNQKGVGIPTVEVHISEVSEREAFRRVSYIRDVAVKTICGHGLDGYNEALDFLIDYIGEKNEG